MAAPQGATSLGPQCPNHSLGATNGWLATVTTDLVSLVIGTQDPLKTQRWGRRELSLLLSGSNRLHIKRGAPEHRDSWALTGSLALTP